MVTEQSVLGVGYFFYSCMYNLFLELTASEIGLYSFSSEKLVFRFGSGKKAVYLVA